MLKLKEADYIGEGLIRTCYAHPKDKNLCIKVPKPHVTREYTYKEIVYFLKLKKRNTSKFQYQFYSDYHGEIETELGTGQIFDLVRDDSSSEVSKTLEYYLTNDTQLSDDQLWETILRLKEQMITHKVFTRDLRARNLCVKVCENGNLELIIIDGIGHRDFFPLADYFNYFSKKKVERTFAKWRFTSLEAQRAFLSDKNAKV